MYLTACLKLLGVLGGSRWRWLLSWQTWGLRGPWAGYWARGMSYSPAAEPPPARPCRPSSSAPVVTASLKDVWSRCELFSTFTHECYWINDTVLIRKAKCFPSNEDEKWNGTVGLNIFNAYPVAVPPGSTLCRNTERWGEPEDGEEHVGAVSNCFAFFFQANINHMELIKMDKQIY